MKLDPLVSVVIPIYNEDDYLNTCLRYLLAQTAFRMGAAEVILVEYAKGLDISEPSTKYLDKNIKHIIVGKKGISYARNLGISKSAPSSIAIVNMDADSVFNRNDAIEIMTEPILKGRAILTKCDVYHVDDIDIEHNCIVRDSKTNDAANFFRDLWHAFYLDMEKYLPIAHTSGLCFAKSAWKKVDGFWNYNMEDTQITMKICNTYGLNSKIWVPDACVFTSTRRIKSLDLRSFVDWGQAIRKNGEKFSV